MLSGKAWSEVISEVDSLRDYRFDEPLVAEFERAAHARRHANEAIRFHVPSFKRYESSEITPVRAHRWPAVSVTGGACKLQCDHCKARILEPMIPATTPAALWQVASDEIAAGARGMLLTGGSNLRDEVEYDRFYPVIRRIKDQHPRFRIAMHTALVAPDVATSMAQAGVDVAMLDIIGAQDTVTQVYHLKRPVQDFEESLNALTRTSMRVVPHIVIGLHYGQLLGEWNALEMIARHRPDGLVLVVVMPFYAHAARPFATPDPSAVGRFLLDARRTLADMPIMLGCARPPGATRARIDAYAVMAGLNGIAHPADGVIELAARLQRTASMSASCCSMSVDSALMDESDETDVRIDLDALKQLPAVPQRQHAIKGIKVVAA
jgi:uncharacterized radical SAM superfamily protein